jgi:hypothetical protein
VGDGHGAHARATAGLRGGRGRRAIRERPRLTLASAARGVQRLGQPLDLAPQPIALAFQPRVVVAKPIRVLARSLDLLTQPLQLSLGVIDRLR